MSARGDGRLEVAGHAHIGRVRVRVKLAEAARPGLVELRMECEALQAAFGSLCLNINLPGRCGEVQVWRYGLAIGADGEQLPIHVAGEVSAGACFVEHCHDPREAGAGATASPPRGRSTNEIKLSQIRRT